MATEKTAKACVLASKFDFLDHFRVLAILPISPPPSVAPSVLAILSCLIALNNRALRPLLFRAIKQLRRARTDGATQGGGLIGKIAKNQKVRSRGSTMTPTLPLAELTGNITEMKNNKESTRLAPSRDSPSGGCLGT